MYLAGSARQLPPSARYVDSELAAMDADLKWLSALSPLHSDEMWERFEKSGFSAEPTLTYAPLTVDPPAVRRQLADLPIAEVEDPLLKAIFAEKRSELELFTYLVELRDTEGALATSIQLFGGVAPHVSSLAHDILRVVVDDHEPETWLDYEHVVSEARAMFTRYRSMLSGFQSEIVIDADLNSHIMVENGVLHVARSIRVPEERLPALLAHEIGTHIVTYENGRRQPLAVLRAGLASYDELQEGLGAFAEYLAGNLPPVRLRILAARVVAAELVMAGGSIVEIFSTLHRQHGIRPQDAFDIAVRAKRGGGLTKDIVYLRGLHELHEYLKAGGDLQDLYLGKFALSHVSLIRGLRDRGWITSPAVLPEFLFTKAARERLRRALNLPLQQLCQRRPEPS